ncbi:MAG: FAD-dependent oxidoreductase [Frankiales bacterium]|nr:FAD-dependent oxidoreductase [Frankiales bacterium]
MRALPRDRSGAFVNWARTERSRPLSWRVPTTEREVVDVVGAARAAGTTVRVVGAGHSWSRIAAPDGLAVSLDRLAGPVEIDGPRRTVSVPAGIRLRALSSALLRAGLSLPIVGSIQAQTVGGAIATGTHGSSLTHGNLSTLVTEARIVTGTGEVLDIGSGDERLDAVRVHLGALGVVTRVRLRVQPAGRLHQSIEQVPVGEVAEALPEIAGSAEYVKVWWLAHATRAQVVRYTRTDDPVTRRPSAATSRWVDERVMHRSVFPALVALQHRRPLVTGRVNERLSRTYLGAASQVGQDALMLNTPMPMRHRETEAAVPMADAPEALRRVLELFRDGRPAVSFPLEIRFVRGDHAWMSPAYGSDTCQIGAYSTNGPDCTPYFDAFWGVMRPLGARPHWGKELDHTAAELRPLYPAFERFAALRDQLDPGRVFGGDFHRRILGS